MVAPIGLNEALASSGLKCIDAPLRWLDNHDESLVRTLLAAEPGYSHAPRDVGTQPRAQPVCMPAVNLHRFHNAIVSSRSSSVFLADRVVLERVAGVDPAKCDFIAGQIFGHDTTQARVLIRGAVIDIPRGIFLGGYGANNYYHLLVEILPRLQHLFEDGMFANYPLLVDESVEQVPNFRTLIEVGSGGHPYLTLRCERGYRVADLAYVSTPNLTPLNLRPDVACELEYTLTRPSTIAYLRERFFDAIAPTHGELPKRVFFARRPGLRDYNQDEIRAIFEAQGFVSVHMDDLSVAQQVELMRHVEVVAGPTGAAWANLTFCRAGTEALCWMADSAPNWSVYSNLAHAAGVNLHYLRYAAGLTSTRQLYRLGYQLDAEQVRQAIEQLWGMSSASAA
jgi:capsular polysaccharide biosynthesis protein